MVAGFRLAVSLLTVVPMAAPRRDRVAGSSAILFAPLVGAGVGLLAGVVLWSAAALGVPGLVGGALAVGTTALATRGMHVDGLADTADGLGCYGPPERALAVMKAPDTGAFGVVTLLVVLLAQVGSLAALVGTPSRLLLPLLAAAVGRLAITWACRAGVPAARPEGLGALVAGAVPVLAATIVSALVVIVAAFASLAADLEFWRGPLAVGLGLATAWVLVRHCVRRFGGITGDVLGAACELATTAALITLTVNP